MYMYRIGDVLRPQIVNNEQYFQYRVLATVLISTNSDQYV